MISFRLFEARNQRLSPSHINAVLNCIFFAWIILCNGCFGNDTLLAQESSDAGKILESDAFPWFDAQTHEAKPLPFETRPDVRSGDRSSIPNYLPRGGKNAGFGGAGLPGVGSGDISFLFWFVLAIVLLSILGLMVWAFLKLESKNQQSVQSSARRSLSESIEQLPFKLDDETGDFRSLAQRASQAGDFRRAIIYLYSHLLVVLDQSGLIRLRKGKTNRQYVRELNRQTTLVPFFEKTMESFESVFFGDHEISREEFEGCWNRLPQFQAELERKLAAAGEVTLEN